MKLFPHFRDLERTYGVTWHELVEREPRLAELLWGARQASVTCRRWSDVDRTFSPLRNFLAELVGFSSSRRSHPILGSVQAYEVAYWRLYEATAGLLLPPGWGSRETAAGAGASASPNVVTLAEAAAQ
jgi:hypothetical protein